MHLVGIQFTAMFKKLSALLTATLTILTVLAVSPTPVSAATVSVAIYASGPSGGVPGVTFRIKKRNTYDEISMRYKAALGRYGDPAGIANYQASSYTLNQMTTELLASGEFSSTYGNPSNSTFVNNVYINLTGSGADSGGLSYWTGLMNNGMSRTSLIDNLLLPANLGSTAWVRATDDHEMNQLMGTYTTGATGAYDYAIDDSSNYSITVLSVPAGYYDTGTNAIMPLTGSKTFNINAYAKLTITTRSPYTGGSNWGSTPIKVNGTTYTTNSSGTLTYTTTSPSGTVTIEKLTRTGSPTTLFYAPTTITQSYSPNQTYAITIPYFRVASASTTTSPFIRLTGPTATATASTTISNFDAYGPTATVRYELHGPYPTSALGTKETTPQVYTATSSSHTSSSLTRTTSPYPISVEAGWYSWEVTTTVQDAGYGTQTPLVQAFGSAALKFEVRKAVTLDAVANNAEVEFQGTGFATNSIATTISDLSAGEQATLKYEVFGPKETAAEISDAIAKNGPSDVTTTVTGTSASTETHTQSFDFDTPGYYGVKTTLTLDSGTSSVIDTTWNSSGSDAIFKVSELVDLKGYAFATNPDGSGFMPVDGLVVEVKNNETGEVLTSTFTTGEPGTESPGFFTTKVKRGNSYCVTPVAVPDTKVAGTLGLSPISFFTMNRIETGNIVADAVDPGGYDGTVVGTPASSGDAIIFDGTDDNVAQSAALPISGGSFSTSVTFTVDPDNKAIDQTVFTLFENPVTGKGLSLNVKNTGAATRTLKLDMLGSQIDLGTITTNSPVTVVITYDDTTGIIEATTSKDQVSPYAGSIGNFDVDPVLHVGSYANLAQFFAGSVSEISVYDRILSTADIETLYDISEEPTYILGTKSYCTNGPVTTGITENRAIQIPVSYEGELAASGFGFEADRNSDSR